jgi:hypothetical protein
MLENPLDDVISRRHAAPEQSLVDLFDVGVVAFQGWEVQLRQRMVAIHSISD